MWSESQDEAVATILADKVKAGDVVVVRYEGPKGGPGMQEMLYPPATSSQGPGQGLRAADRRALLRAAPRACRSATARPRPRPAAPSAWCETATASRIDIPNRTINVLVSDEELARRRQQQAALGWKPASRVRAKCPAALKAYAKLVTSADTGAVRDLSLLD